MAGDDTISTLASALMQRVSWETELDVSGYAPATTVSPDLPAPMGAMGDAVATGNSTSHEERPVINSGVHSPPAPAPAPEAVTTEDLPAGKTKAHALSELKFQLESCTQCGLHKHRSKIVFADGTMHARLAFVGASPTKEEDLISLPFVGAQGHLLNRIIVAIGERRENCYLCNVIKCFPGETAPADEHIQTCGAHLLRQLELVSPKVVVALGQSAASFLLQDSQPVDGLRGKFTEVSGMQIMPTFSLSHMLENPASKRDVWNDMKQVKQLLESL